MDLAGFVFHLISLHFTINSEAFINTNNNNTIKLVKLANDTIGKDIARIAMIHNIITVPFTGVLVCEFTSPNSFGIHFWQLIPYSKREVIIICTKIPFITANILIIVITIGGEFVIF